jgi:hypothetical protein
MLAELSEIESGPVRWRFALSCTRAALSLPATMFKVGQRLLVAGVVGGAVVLAGQIHFAAARREAIAMVAILTAVSWLGRRIAIFGPVAAGRTARLVSAGALALVATKALILINDERLSPRRPDVTTVTIVVWTTILTIYTLALVRVTARRSAVSTHTLATGAGIGVAAAAAWLTAAVIHPSVTTSSASAVAAIAAGAVCAEFVSARRAGRREQNRIAALCAAAGAALLIAILIDGPLRTFSRWVPNNAPPIDSPQTVDRLVDSIGIWLLGCLLATALTLAVRATRPTPRPDPTASETAAYDPTT